MKIVTLIENMKGDSTDLINEHGLCLYIESQNKRILFDTGRTENFIINAKKLGVSLDKVDAVILSHGHADHGGGLLSFLKVNSRAKVYMRKKALEKHFFHCMFFNKNVSIDEKALEQYSERIKYVDDFTEIMKDVYVITDIENYHVIPKGNKYLFVEEGKKLVRDKFQHELIMVIKEDDGSCIFTGCSHNGTANMIRTARKNFPNDNIKAVIGGFHLVIIPIIKSLSASQHEIDTIANKIIEENIEKVYTGHCTGEKGYEKLKSILGDKIEYIKTGTHLEI